MIFPKSNEFSAPRYRIGNAWRAVGKNLGWMLASRGVLAVLSLFYLGIITRSLGVAGFGRFALVAGAAQALSTLVAFQSWQVVVQFGIGAAQADDEEALGRLFRGSLILDLSSAIIGAGLAAIILIIWSDQFGIGPTLQRAALIYAIVQVVTIRSTPLGILRLSDRFSYAALAESMTPVARFVGAWVVLLVHPTVQGYLAAWGAAEVLTAVTYWILARKVGGWRLIRHGRGMKRLLAEHPGLLRFAVSTNASSTLGLASKQLPLLVVGAALGPAAAGTFRLASQIAQSLAKLSQLVARAAFPEVVRAVRQAEDDTVRRILSRTLMASAVTGTVIMVLVGVAGDPVLRLIGGRGFGHTFPVLMGMAAAGCIDLATVGLDTVMTARGRAGTVFIVRATAVVSTFAAAVWLVPQFYAFGMALAVVAGSVTAAMLLAAVTWRSLC